MRRLPGRFKALSALAGMALCVLVQTGHATTPVVDAAATLNEAESIRTKDHPRFVRLLEQVQAHADELAPSVQWHLRYLTAWEVMFSGDYPKSETQLHEVIERSGDPVLVAKASALLLTNLGANRRYEEAYALANRLTSGLPDVKDPVARSMLLMNLSQMLDLAGQTDLSIQYSHMLENALAPGETLCHPHSLQVAALYNGRRLNSSSAEIQRAIDTCVAGNQPVLANTNWLVLDSLYIAEKKPAKALALLDRIAPSIRTNQYFPHLLSLYLQRAQSLAQLGDDEGARKAALEVVSMSSAVEISEWLKEAYEVLYGIEKRRGNADAALAYYEKYLAQDKGYLNDVSARALAYEVAQQHMLVQKFETERLNKQNNILRLQQALDTKAVETSRLYIALLLVILASIVVLLFRLKRSQMRFRELSCRDGLTGIHNHQHFMSEAERLLRAKEKKGGMACLVSIDLDHFKQVNDTYGHAVGDAVLRRTVSACQTHLRSTDLFGRLGGEEFGILLIGCSREEGVAIADRIRMAIAATPVEEDGHVVSFSASVGLACTGASGYQLQKLCRDADAALYRAKRTGRNRVIADNDTNRLIVA
ncbi:diguanylate cyclase (GGDEF)-like protein [Luteibacter sp. Sphag1AF]|uniref:tetratricopeptide repeat-containing diguanylate cyclase n=1 Tax=Luteibacter sp. Sphag1AF TaxID=2587031 RepID=UPI00160E09EC|nr:GGDEF domain-containing protein [Luteibacter sp. Sphag1AF]MBB3226550.1 diguanylate cyclase (GGDEF)-like protein [Luteibacter sp. Sphag1AF]